MRVTGLMCFLLLAGFGAQALAQGMQTFAGVRNEGANGISASAATFALGMTRDNGASYVGSAGTSDLVQVRAEIRPDPAHVGQRADIFLVVRLLDTDQWLLRRQDGAWVPWDVRVATLVPFRADVLLTDVLPVEIFSGRLGVAGNHRVFMGYAAADGVLHHQPSGLPLAIHAQTQSAGAQALALFTSTISPDIVAVTCSVCHRPGGTAPSVGAYSLQIPPESNVEANFAIFRGLVQQRGAQFVLTKAAGGNAHSGGMQLQPGSAEYQQFASFLNLLAEDLGQ